MKLKFYGTRGSIPICDAGFQQFGGNTTCLQITFTDTNRIAIIDAGTGLRNLGRDLLAIGHKQEQIVIAFTHFHWDHIQGFPFFAPAYDPGQKITFLDARPGSARRSFAGDLRGPDAGGILPGAIGSHGSRFRVPANRRCQQTLHRHQQCANPGHRSKAQPSRRSV